MHSHSFRPFACSDVFPLNGPVRAIRYPKDGQLRSRKVVSRSKTRSTGKYPAWKIGRMLQWESPHELNAFRLLDANPAVLAFREQPLVVSYVLDGVLHDHYPDIEVHTARGKELWEVKTREDALSPEVTGRTRLLSASLPTLGYTYRVVVAEELAAEPQLSNALLALRHGRAPVGPQERERVRMLLGRHPCLTWGAILDGAFGPNGRAIACRLLLEGVLRIDTGQPIGRDSAVTMSTVAMAGALAEAA